MEITSVSVSFLARRLGEKANKNLKKKTKKTEWEREREKRRGREGNKIERRLVLHDTLIIPPQKKKRKKERKKGKKKGPSDRLWRPATWGSATLSGTDMPDREAEAETYPITAPNDIPE